MPINTVRLRLVRMTYQKEEDGKVIKNTWIIEFWDSPQNDDDWEEYIRNRMEEFEILLKAEGTNREQIEQQKLEFFKANNIDPKNGIAAKLEF